MKLEQRIKRIETIIREFLNEDHRTTHKDVNVIVSYDGSDYEVGVVACAETNGEFVVEYFDENLDRGEKTHIINLCGGSAFAKIKRLAKHEDFKEEFENEYTHWDFEDWLIDFFDNESDYVGGWKQAYEESRTMTMSEGKEVNHRLNNRNSAVIEKGSTDVKVGCQTFHIERIRTLVEKYDKLQATPTYKAPVSKW